MEQSETLRAEVLERLKNDYGFKARHSDIYWRGGKCPACGKKELYTRVSKPWLIICGRESKCAKRWHVKELYEDLFDDWSRRAPSSG